LKDPHDVQLIKNGLRRRPSVRPSVRSQRKFSYNVGDASAARYLHVNNSIRGQVDVIVDDFTDKKNQY